MQILHESDEIEISYEPGISGTAIVSFSGIGLRMGGIQIAEFRKSLAGMSNHLYFVKDKTRHWYNSSFDEITKLLNEDFEQRGVKNVLTLGNSMGGFGAIIFAGRLSGCRSAIAFAAQSSVDPSIVPWEQRYTKYTDTVSHWAGLDASKLLAPDVNYTLIYGDKSGIDIRHATRMAETDCPGMSMYLIVGAAHAVAGFLKRNRVLRLLIQVLVANGGRSLDARAVLHDMEYRAPMLAPGFH